MLMRSESNVVTSLTNAQQPGSQDKSQTKQLQLCGVNTPMMTVLASTLRNQSCSNGNRKARTQSMESLDC